MGGRRVCGWGVREREVVFFYAYTAPSPFTFPRLQVYTYTVYKYIIYKSISIQSPRLPAPLVDRSEIECEDLRNGRATIPLRHYIYTTTVLLLYYYDTTTILLIYNCTGQYAMYCTTYPHPWWTDLMSSASVCAMAKLLNMLLLYYHYSTILCTATPPAHAPGGPIECRARAFARWPTAP